MPLIDRITNAYRALITPPEIVTETKDVGTSTAPPGSLMYSLGLMPSNTGIPVSPISALQATTAYACVRRLSEDLAKLPIRVRSRSGRGGWVDRSNHPLLKLIRKPNDWQTQFELISGLVAAIQLRGNGYLYVVRDPDGEPVKLLPAIPDRVSVVQTSVGNILYYVTLPYFGGQTVIANPQDDMVHIRNLSLDGGILGISPIAASQDTLALALASAKHGALFFKQGMALSGLLSTPQKLSDEARKNLSRSWMEAYGGGDKAHKVAVLENDLRFEAISIKPQEAQLLESQKWSAEQICRVFGVPPWLVGLPVATGTYSNVEQSQIQYVTNTLQGLATKIEQEFQRVLLWEEERDNIRIDFDFDSLLRGDTKSRMDSYQIGLLNGVFSINEVREREGLEAIEGGDEHRVPLNTGPAANPPSDTSQEEPVGGQPSDAAQTPEAHP